jgi:hypothetical protein
VEKAECYYRAKKIFGNHVNTNYVRISVIVDGHRGAGRSCA